MMEIPSTITNDTGNNLVNKIFGGLLESGAEFISDNFFGGKSEDQLNALRKQNSLQAELLSERQKPIVASQPIAGTGLTPSVLFLVGGVAVVALFAFGLSRRS